MSYRLIRRVLSGLLDFQDIELAPDITVQAGDLAESPFQGDAWGGRAGSYGNGQSQTPPPGAARSYLIRPANNTVLRILDAAVTAGDAYEVFFAVVTAQQANALEAGAAVAAPTEIPNVDAALPSSAVLQSTVTVLTSTLLLVLQNAGRTLWYGTRDTNQEVALESLRRKAFRLTLRSDAQGGAPGLLIYTPYADVGFAFNVAVREYDINRLKPLPV